MHATPIASSIAMSTAMDRGAGAQHLVDRYPNVSIASALMVVSQGQARTYPGIERRWSMECTFPARRGTQRPHTPLGSCSELPPIILAMWASGKTMLLQCG
jgi:hypothetical protein